MIRFALRGLAVASLVCAATAVSAQQTQSTPNPDQPKMEHGETDGTGHAQPSTGPGTGSQGMGSQGMGMGQKGMEMGKEGMGMGQQAPGHQGTGQGGMMQEMHKMHQGAAPTPPAATTPESQTGHAPAPSPQCPPGTTVQMEASGQHVCK